MYNKLFVNYLKFEKRFSDHTITAYSNDIIQFEEYLIDTYGEIDVKDCTKNHIRSFITFLVSNEVSNRSINRKVSSIRRFYSFLQREEIVISNPCKTIKSLKTPKRLPKVAKAKELFNIRKVCLDQDDQFVANRDYCIMELLYQTGIRRSELLSIKEDDIGVASSLKVLGKGNKERLIPISEKLTRSLVDYKRIKKEENLDSDYLFVSKKNKKLYPKAVFNIVKKYLSLLSTIDKKSPHMLRHSFATHMMEQGADINAVKTLLGHSSLAATQVYTHNTIRQLKEIYSKAHPKSTNK